jgi:2,5-diketo-D-gluconate reductase B
MNNHSSNMNRLTELAMVHADAIPRLGLGTYGRTGAKGTAAMLKAIEIGYRHLDTAQTYDTESTVGEAVRGSGLPRGDFFITTKVADFNLDRSKFMPSVEKSLATMGLGPADLLLIHWPSPGDLVPIEHCLEALARAQQLGHARLIGVSNFTIAHLERTTSLLGKGAIATNQVEIHPYLQAPKLCAYAKRIGLTLTAYQPLAQGRVGADPVVAAVAERLGSTPAAVALAFLMAEGHMVIPASSSETHLRANFAADKVRLSADDMVAIRKLERGLRVINPSISPRWDD